MSKTIKTTATNESDKSNNKPEDKPKGIPRYHDFIALGIEHKQAMKWHDAITCIESHAINMATAIENGALMTFMAIEAARWFRKAHKALKN